MPYHLVKVPHINKFYVVSDKGQYMSKEPLDPISAKRQLKALYMHMKDESKK
jgi:hypothetical protein